MNSGKLRTTRHIWLRETKFQKYLSRTILYKEKEENNKLKKLLRQINYCRRTSCVGVPPLFGHFETDFDCISDFDDTCQLCKYEHTPR